MNAAQAGSPRTAAPPSPASASPPAWSASPTPPCRSTTCSAASPASTARRRPDRCRPGEVLDRDDRGALRRQRRAGPELALRARDAGGRGQARRDHDRPLPGHQRGPGGRDRGRDLQRPARPRRRPTSPSSNASASPSRRSQPGESRDSAVVFYVDPALARTRTSSDLKSITLSYTFFPAKGGQPVAEAATSVSEGDDPISQRDKLGAA